jgi:HAD superfamily hydrolase (TIGR01549 family)
MDTLVHMDIPTLDLYPLWAFEGAQTSGLWDGYVEFRHDWIAQRERFVHDNGGLREQAIGDRVRAMIARRLEALGRAGEETRIEETVRRIQARYWRRYLAASVVPEEARRSLEALRERGLKLGVVSNFIVPGGVGSLLARHQLADFFSVVVVSCNVGWKKPAEPIYRVAIRWAGVHPSRILFVGDNQLADYDGPRLLGMKPLLYDPQQQSPETERRIRSLEEVRDWL